MPRLFESMERNPGSPNEGGGDSRWQEHRSGSRPVGRCAERLVRWSTHALTASEPSFGCGEGSSVCRNGGGQTSGPKRSSEYSRRDYGDAGNAAAPVVLRWSSGSDLNSFPGTSDSVNSGRLPEGSTRSAEDVSTFA